MRSPLLIATLGLATACSSSGTPNDGRDDGDGADSDTLGSDPYVFVPGLELSVPASSTTVRPGGMTTIRVGVTRRGIAVDHRVEIECRGYSAVRCAGASSLADEVEIQLVAPLDAPTGRADVTLFASANGLFAQQPLQIEVLGAPQISGQVVAVDATPIPHATVELWVPLEGKVATATAGIDGWFTIDHDALESFDLVVDVGPTLTGSQTHIFLELDDSPVTLRTDTFVAPATPTTVSGVLVADGYTAAAGAGTLVSMSGPRTALATTVVSAGYAFSNVPRRQTYRLAALQGTYGGDVALSVPTSFQAFGARDLLVGDADASADIGLHAIASRAVTFAGSDFVSVGWRPLGGGMGSLGPYTTPASWSAVLLPADARIALVASFMWQFADYAVLAAREIGATDTAVTATMPPAVAFALDGSTSATAPATASLVVTGGFDLQCRFQVYTDAAQPSTSIRVQAKTCTLPLSAIVDHGHAFAPATTYHWSAQAIYDSELLGGAAPYSLDAFVARALTLPTATSRTFDFTTAP